MIVALIVVVTVWSTLIFQGGRTRKRIRELELPSGWSLRIEGLYTPSGWIHRIRELEPKNQVFVASF
jgi:hypothetical protein